MYTNFEESNKSTASGYWMTKFAFNNLGQWLHWTKRYYLGITEGNYTELHLDWSIANLGL